MTDTYKFVREWQDAGTPGYTSLLVPAMRNMYLSRPEIRTHSLEEWVQRMTGYLTARLRCEILAYHEGKVIGATSLAIADDLHVGPTLEVLATFIDLEHRHSSVIKGFSRASKSIAKSLGLKTLSVTKYQGPYKYSLRYIPIS